MSRSARPAVTIVIPAKNEEARIGLALAAVADMDAPEGGFEVIVVDNGSSDGTCNVARSWAGRLAISVLEIPSATISALRNAGARQAQGEFLAFLDADCLPPRNWLRDGLSILRGAPGVTGGFYDNPAEAGWVARVWYGDEVERKSGDVSYVPSGNLMIARREFFSAGGFDETLTTNEDYEFCQRVIAAGLPVRSYRNLAVVHLGTPNSIGHFYRKQRWHGRSVAAVFFRDLPRLRNLSSVAFAFYTLGCAAALAAGLIAGALGGYWLPAAAAAAALVGAPVTLAAVKAATTGRPERLVPFAALFLVFGAARALCLIEAVAGPKHASERSERTVTMGAARQ